MVGLYVVVSLFILPCNRDGIRVSAVLGSALLAFLLYYGKELFLQNLMSGVVIAVMSLTLVPFLWKKYLRCVYVICSGYFFLLFPSPKISTKKEVESNLTTVVDE